MKNLRRLTLLAILLAATLIQAQEARLLRFPAIHNDQVVFTYAGDLYTVTGSGETARRLTGHDGFEMFAHFSPDGQWLAFTGQYDGNTEVYLMPAQGGQPKRLTYTATLDRDDVSDRMGPNNIVMGWTPDGKSVIFRSRMNSFNPFIGQLFTISIDGGLPTQLEVPRGGFCSLMGDKMAYNRVFREFRTWKRYDGGMADDVWIYDFKDHTTVNITDNPAQDIFPMWHGDQIYYISDRQENRRMNLYAYDTKKKTTRKLTDFQDFDIKFPSLGNKAIIFENGGWLYRLDLPNGKPRKIEIFIREDLSIGRNQLISVDNRISSADIAPDGKRALLGARGDIFTVPARYGEPRNLTATPGVHERDSVWSPDGKWIAYISDKTGEDQLYLVPQDGATPARQITTTNETYLFNPRWSPDSRKLLWSDRCMRLRWVDIDTQVITDITTVDTNVINQYEWSPDSQWIVYVRPEWQTMSNLMLYNLATGDSFPVTDGWFEVADPCFSHDGKYLFFASNRDFSPIYSWTEWNHAYVDMEKLYLIPLAADTLSPFQYESDETKPTPAADADPSKEPDTADTNADDDNNEPAKTDKKPADKADAKPAVTVTVDREGIINRTIGLPVPASSYRQLRSAGDNLYYIRNGAKDDKSLLLRYDLKEKKQIEIGSLSSYEISADGKKMLVRQNGKFGIIDLPKDKIQIEEPLRLDNLKVALDRQAEWHQIFNECWRQMREFFHVPNMHGVDWPTMRERYAPLVASVNHRADLTYVIGEMVSELNAGHAYVGGGDFPHPDRIQLGLLGATLSRDEASGYYRIESILPGENWDPELRSPLTEVGVNIRATEYITAVDGTDTTGVNNIYQLLIDKAGRQVTLTVNEMPAAGGRTVIVKPIADESPLYYHKWVRDNIQTVSTATGDKVGYIHVPDMGVPGLNEFVKYFYPQLNKKALIIDVRGNGGGNVSPMLIERLRREIAMITYSRNGAPRPNPSEMIWGPMVCLCNEYSASDGDLFTYRFRQHKLGTIIGKTTWGGVVGISGSLPLLDGGSLTRPEHSRYDVEGKEYIIEGVGVTPDIIVDNDPWLELQGTDQQLDKAIEVILQQLQTQEKTIPPLPPYPVK